MMCALEMATRQQAILAEKKNMENAKKFCENVVIPTLLEQVNKGDAFVYGYFYFEDEGFAKPVIPDGLAYSTGELSYHPDPQSAPLHIPTVVKYLKDHCYHVTDNRCTYRQYGSGYHRGWVIHVYLPALEDIKCAN